MGVPSTSNDQHVWQLLGAVIRLYRQKAQVGMRELAAAIPVHHSAISKWERGLHQPPADTIKTIDDKLSAGGHLIALYDAMTELTALRAGTVKTIPSTVGEDMDGIRRQLLAGLVLGVAAPADLLDGLDNLRNLIDSRIGSSQLSWWEETAWEYGYRILGHPELIPELARDLLAVQQLADSAPSHETPGWTRVIAQMAFCLAYALGSAGHARESHRWWASARRAAERSGDAQLLAAVCGYEALQGLYEDRPLPLVQKRIDDALAASPAACPGVVEAIGGLAQVHAIQGDHDRAYATLDEQARRFERLPDATGRHLIAPDGWPVGRLLHNRSYIYTLTGHPSAAQAQEEALKAAPPGLAAPIAQLELHRAITAVRSGDILSGLDHARAVLTRLAASQQTRYVRHVASTVLHAVPAGERSRPAVAEYREMIALPPGERTV